MNEEYITLDYSSVKNSPGMFAIAWQSDHEIFPNSISINMMFSFIRSKKM